jgi:hypothetical protein
MTRIRLALQRKFVVLAGTIAYGLALFAVVLILLSIPVISELSGAAPAVTNDQRGSLTGADSAVADKQPESGKEADTIALDDRIAMIEKALSELNRIQQMDENRGYQIKMMARELIRYVRVVVFVLVAIAIVFPFCFWLLGRRGLDGQSQMASTLLAVEERQAKLTNIFKDLQDEIDVLHTLSAPDLKKLIAQAEKYLEQNETDLGKTGSPKE